MSLIAGDELKRAAGKYLEQVQARSQSSPLRFMTIFDKWFIRVFTRLASLEPGKSWEEGLAAESARAPAGQQGLEWDFLHLRLFLNRWQDGRFVTYADREKAGADYYPRYGTEFGTDVLLTCQGAPHCLTWRGHPLMKNVFDFALYPQLIAELRPATIFEIGSGSGASALWLADQMEILKIPGRVYSVDLVPVTGLEHPGVSFTAGDCMAPETLFSQELLSSARHPWLVIEDAHLNVEAVLNQMHPSMGDGDYLMVEDSDIKREAIRGFMTKHPDSYMVDTKYTDFFGRNATSALDSIFVRMSV